jgi:hypothetical protein
MGKRREAGISRAFPAQVALLGRRRENLERHDHIAGIAFLRIERGRFRWSDDDVRLGPIGIGDANAKPWQHIP